MFSYEFCEISKHLFFTEHLRTTASAFSSFAATLLKWGTANIFGKPQMNTPSRNTNLRRTVQVYHFFLSSINFQCMFTLVYTVYCQKQPPEVFCKKSVLKNFVNFIGKHLCWSHFSTLLKRDSNADVLLSNLRNF